MSVRAILLPVFAQVALIVGLLFVMASRRLAVFRAGEVRKADLSLGQRNWPASAQQASNAFSNQFEVPMLFFALAPLAVLTREADLLFVVLSWLFVLTRIVHAAVYVTSNRISHRIGAFAAGVVVLAIMWIVFAIRILGAPATV